MGMVATMQAWRAITAALAAGAILAAPASAQELTSAKPDPRGCVTTERTGQGIVTRALTAPQISAIDARLDAGGDWDLAVTDAATGRVLAGSASPGGSEIAQGFAEEGQRLIVRACRLSGGDKTASLDLDLIPLDAPADASRPSLVNVYTPTEQVQRRLDGLGLDLTEHAGSDERGPYRQAVVRGPLDASKLDAAGFETETVVEDLVAQQIEQQREDRAYSRATVATGLPSGRTTYRRLFDYESEMRDLAEDNPDLVTPVTLPNQTYEGRTVQGIEITTNPGDKADGKPVFLQMGVHHAREWPSGEHAMEWAYELIQGYRSDDARLKPLVENTRTIIIPIVNPDGFNTSREAGEVLGHGGGNPEDDTTIAAVTAPFEFRRKNCRLVDDSDAGNCSQPAIGLASPGVDPNRNYGGFWGGPGAGTMPTDEDYRGPGPFSEPESQNIRSLVSARQVVTLITNHTFSDLVLRPPGVAAQGDPVDEPVLKALGDAMAAQNGYLSQKGFELYDTTGTTEDWSYYTTGGLGYTFEIGCVPGDPADAPNENCIGNFHPPFAETVAEYDGTSAAATAVGGGGNREAYAIAQESTANATRHSIVRGEAPAGATLRISKSVMTPTSPQPDANGEPILVEDNLSSELAVGPTGSFEWHINPSTRPLVAQERGRASLGDPSDPVTDTGDSTTTTPPVGCADFETTDPNCWNDHPFTIPDGAGTDNDAATVNVSWTVPVNDWDIKVFRDTDSNGTSVGEPAGAEVGQSGNSPPGTEESVTFVDPEQPDGRLQAGDYVVRVVNFAAPAPDPYTVNVSFAGPEDPQAAQTEAWTLTCSLDGSERTSTQVTIERGEAQDLDLSGCQRGADQPGGGQPDQGQGQGQGQGNGDGPRCAGKVVTLRATGRRVSGTPGRDVILGLRGSERISGGRGNDVICAGGGRDRVSGGPGADTLYGQGGKDKLFGGKGRDRCRGGKGRDRERGC